MIVAYAPVLPGKTPTSGAKDASRNGPVIITDQGRPAQVLLVIEEYYRLAGGGHDAPAERSARASAALANAHPSAPASTPAPVAAVPSTGMITTKGMAVTSWNRDMAPERPCRLCSPGSAARRGSARWYGDRAKRRRAGNRDSKGCAVAERPRSTSRPSRATGASGEKTDRSSEPSQARAGLGRRPRRSVRGMIALQLLFMI